MGLIGVMGLLGLYPGQGYYQRMEKGRGEVKGETIEIEQVRVPMYRRDEEIPQVSAKAIYIFEPSSGTVMYEKNGDMELAPASTTKLMTALVSVDLFSPDDVLTVDEGAVAVGHTIGLMKGDKLSFENLLMGMLIASGNDAAVTIAENAPGGYDRFVERMNEKAAELGLRDTNYRNVSGIDFSGHVSSVRDLAILAKAASENEEINRIEGSEGANILDVSGENVYRLEPTNLLLGKVEGLLGGKTGWTETAGECLVSRVKRGDREIIVVVLGSNDRFGESEKLIEWAFEAFDWIWI